MTATPSALLLPLGVHLQEQFQGGSGRIHRLQRIQRLRDASTILIYDRISQRLASPAVAQRLAAARSKVNLALDQVAAGLDDLRGAIEF